MKPKFVFWSAPSSVKGILVTVKFNLYWVPFFTSTVAASAVHFLCQRYEHYQLLLFIITNIGSQDQYGN